MLFQGSKFENFSGLPHTETLWFTRAFGTRTANKKIQTLPPQELPRLLAIRRALLRQRPIYPLS